MTHTTTRRLLGAGAIIALLGTLGTVGVGAPAGAATNGQNGRIAYLKTAYSNETGTTFTLRSINPDGSDDRALTSNVDDDDLAWSPDGSRLAYQHAGSIWTMSPDGTDVRAVTTNPAGSGSGRHCGLTWSPSGRQLAFESSGGLRVVNLDGSGLRSLTSAPADACPDWSPDGARLVFTRSDRAFVVDAAGGTPVQLTRIFTHGPRWSPDGTRLAFDGYDGPDAEAPYWRWGYVVNADGTGLTRLGFEAYFASPMAWSPDGTKLVFARDANGGAGLAIAEVDGTDYTFVRSSDTGNVIFPVRGASWAPVPGTYVPPTTVEPTAPLALPAGLRVTGRLKVGSTLKVRSYGVPAVGSSRPAYRFTWYAGTKKIAKATKPSLRLTRTLAGKRISVRVSVTRGTETVAKRLRAGTVRR